MSTAALHVQVGTGLVAAWQRDTTLVAALGGASAQIRTALDCSGSPAGAAAVVVRVADLGGYGGTAGRTLVNLQVRVSVRSHLDEDASGAAHDAALARVIELLAGTQATLATLDGWAIRHAAAPQTEDVEMADAAFRATDAVQRLIAQAMPAAASSAVESSGSAV